MDSKSDKDRDPDRDDPTPSTKRCKLDYADVKDIKARPSDKWHQLEDFDSDTPLYRRLKHILSTADFAYLQKRAVRACLTQQSSLSSELACKIDSSRFAWGFNNLVLEVAFSNGSYWIARIQHTFDDAEKQPVALLSEIATMKIVRDRTDIPVPCIYDYDTRSDNPLGYPFLLMEYIDGNILDGPLAKRVPLKHHPKVAKQLAHILFELQKVTFDSIGRVWCGESGKEPARIVPQESRDVSDSFSSSLDYFYAHRQAENQDAIATHPDDAEWLTACWVLKTALPHIVIEDRIHGPFPICHLDLHYGNLLLDDDFNLVGVIDWSNAQTVPLERLAVTPELITFPGLSDEENRPTIEFKNLVVQSLRMEEASSEAHAPAPTPLSTFLASKRAEITHRCTYSNPRRALWDAKLVRKLIYDNKITWEQLKDVYGNIPLY